MAFYLIRSTIRKLPAAVIHDIPKPQPNIIEGFGSRAKVGEICKRAGHKSVLLVTDKTLFSLGFHEDVVKSLEDNKIEYSVFNDISSEPTLEIVRKGRKAALDCKATCIIALGGGSVMDSSKMIAAWTKRPSSSVSCPKFLLLKDKSLSMINIPSTAGTGAEITVGAIVKKTEQGAKNSTVIYGLDVSDVILDSELTYKAPDSVTVACGIDALSHGLEGVVGDVRVVARDKIKSFECVRLVLENLGLVHTNPNDIKARQAMCKAALYGGNAINKQLAGYVHAFAHSIGAKYHLPHGVAIAYSLIPVMKQQVKSCVYKLAELAHYCHIVDENVDDEAAADAIIQAVENLVRSTGILETNFKIPKKDYHSLSNMIFMDSINYAVPVEFTTNDVFHIIDEINKM